MSEDQAAYGGGKYCGNCGIRADGDCTLDGAEMEHCMTTPGRPHWRKLATDREKLKEFLEAGKVVAQCTEKPDRTGAEQKEFNRDQEGMPCDFCGHHVNGQPSFCVSCDPENSEYEPYEFEVENSDTIKKNNHPVPDLTYSALNRVLTDAYDQAAEGKGKERHATDNRYEDQVICVVGRLLRGHPYGSHAYQIIKKTIEAGRLYKIKGPDAAYNEVLGVINYAAAMNILIAEDE